MKLALTETASSMFGKVRRCHSDWFKESTDELKPLLEHCNTLYTKWLKSGQIQDHLSFKQAQGEARQAICRAKNKLFQAKAKCINQRNFSKVCSLWFKIQHKKVAFATRK